MNINPFKRERSTWKFNCNLLTDIEYVNRINNLIENEKNQYATPRQNRDIPDYELQLSISDHLLLDTLLMQIRGDTIKYASIIQKITKRLNIS